MFLREFKEKWADVDGVRTRYFDEGQGAPIVFIHGRQCGDASGGESAQDFDLNFTPLSKRYRCVAIDRLGQGFTDLPKRDADYTMAASVRSISQCECECDPTVTRPVLTASRSADHEMGEAPHGNASPVSMKWVAAYSVAGTFASTSAGTTCRPPPDHDRAGPSGRRGHAGC